MKIFASLRALFLAVFRRSRVERDMEEELRSHIQNRADDLERSGLPRVEAERRARMKFGGYQKYKEEIRESLGAHFIDTLLQDIRYAARMLRKSPGFTAVAVLTLALGIGVNTAIFSLVDAVLLKQLPVKGPSRLVFIRTASQDAESGGLSYDEFQQIRDRSQSFASEFAFDSTRLVANTDGRSDFVWGQIVSGNFFSTLGVTPLAGRALTLDDDQTGKSPAAVISYDYWKRVLALDPASIGKTIVLKKIPFTIIGVGPRGFRGIELGDSVDVWVPMAFWKQLRLNDHTDVGIMARLTSGATEQRASAELNVIDRQFVTGMIGSSPKSASATDLLTRRITLKPGAKGDLDLPDDLPQELTVLMVVVGVVLLIACANIASLLLARTANRQREIAVRLALGAGPGRLIRQLLTENFLLALGGGFLGFLVAPLALKVLLTFASREIDPLTLDLGGDTRVLWFTVCVSLLTGILFGLAPALRVLRVDPVPGLKAGGANSGHLRRDRLRQILVITQVALSVALLIGTSLLVQSLRKLSRVDTGFHQQNVLLVSLYATLNGYQGSRELNLYSALQQRAAAIPGMQTVAFSRFSLLSGGRWNRTITDRRKGTAAQIDVHCNPVAPQFFQTMSIPMVLGRDFTSADGAAAPPVAIISEAFARRYFPNENPIRKHIEFSDESGAVQPEIVGVVKDVRSMSLREVDTFPAVYIPLAQAPSDILGQVTMEVRSDLPPATVVASLRQAAQNIDSSLPLIEITTQAAQTELSLADEHLLATLSSLFGILALMLASIGLYGLMTYNVMQRTHEIGIRLALGGHPRDVMRLVLEQGARLAFTGIVIGVIASLGLTQFIASLLFGVSTVDAMTFAGVAILLTLVALAACYIPARRAMKVDPMVALRYE